MSKIVLLILTSEGEPASEDGVLRVRDVNDLSAYTTLASQQGAFDEIKVSCGETVTNPDILSGWV